MEVIRPILVANPSNDAAFLAHVEAERAGLERPEDLAPRLRLWYPGVLVRPRELGSEDDVVWYVYRDGHWTHGGVERRE